MIGGTDMGSGLETTRISIFPLSGAILFPGLQMPLHISSRATGRWSRIPSPATG